MLRRLRLTTYGALLIVALSICTHEACAKAPPNLSPQGIADYQKTRVIKVLDIFRDAAVDANALPNHPAWASTANTRIVVEAHKAILLTMDAAGTGGWQAAVTVALDQTLDALPPDARAHYLPYVTLAKALIQEIA